VPARRCFRIGHQHTACRALGRHHFTLHAHRGDFLLWRHCWKTALPSTSMFATTRGDHRCSQPWSLEMCVSMRLTCRGSCVDTSCQVEMVRLLLKHGAYPAVVDDSGKTPDKCRFPEIERVCVCLSVCHSVILSVCLSVCLSLSLSLSLSIHLSLPVRLRLCMSPRYLTLTTQSPSSCASTLLRLRSSKSQSISPISFLTPLSTLRYGGRLESQLISLVT
jgi:hypothetical protein